MVSLNKRILLITYAFPPNQAPESYLSAKSLSYISTFDVDVLTINQENLGIPSDISLDNYIKKNFKNIYRIKKQLWLNAALFHWLRFLLPFPDRFVILNKLIVKKAFEINIEKYSLIISWSQWHSIHLAANCIKKSFPYIPWVVHMSDPWSDNPFLPNIPGFSFIQKFLEKKVLKNADLINFTTQDTLDLVMNKYPKGWTAKTCVIPHAFDPVLYETCNNKFMPNHSLRIIRYLGNFYGPRNPRSFALATAAIYNHNPSLFENIQIEFIGRWIGNFKWKAEDEGVPKGLIVFRSPVTYLESLKLMSESNVLLVIDAPFENSVFFPSKLIDYIGANRPILALTPNGCCANVLKEIGGIIVNPTSVSSIKSGLEVALVLINKSSMDPPNKNLSEKYSAIEISCLYEKHFNELIDTLSSQRIYE